MLEQRTVAVSAGEHHEELGRLLGKWDVELKLVMPGMPPQSSKGTADCAWVIDGRWLGQRIEAKFMGMPFESYSILGYDNVTKNHVTVTVSSFDTAMNMVRGVVVDMDKKVQVLYGTIDEYTTGEFNKPLKVVTRVQDNDHHTIEIWDLGIGAEGAMVLEYVFSRRK